MSKMAFIDQVHIRGFRSLANVELSGIPRAAVLIGANGSGKSNFIRFFEMMSWMLGPRRLGEFVERQGGADDQLFGGNKRSPRLDATVTMRTDAGRNDYRFTPRTRASRSSHIHGRGIPLQPQGFSNRGRLASSRERPFRSQYRGGGGNQHDRQGDC